MDAHARAVLELPAILERLGAETATEPGRLRALALTPDAARGEVERRQALTTEAIALIEAGAAPDVAGASDIRAAAEHAGRGGALDANGLRDVAATIRVGLAARRSLEQAAGQAPLLAHLAAGIAGDLDPIASRIEAAVAEDGAGLLDAASPELRRLRRELRDGRLRVADQLRRLARGGELRGHLQEDFVTERAGRPVLAVKASSRSKVPGIVHDASGSGQTLFVEPFAVVEDNNRLRELAVAERDEVERILAVLSGLVGAGADALAALVDAVGAIDLALACGSLSRRWRGARVEIADEVRLLGARHPLLDAETTVPVDLDLGPLRALVISGPNTGGKTVALKTLGLAALVHQAGLRPPAEAATLPVFDRVLADIGDEQSIAMSLSTFSGHLRNLVEILAAATERSLVLLDEVAAGTDPEEGAALAQALLERLSGQARLTVATSHYPELKEWASASPVAANAATGFDPETHAPLYRVAIGRPGTSHALQIAGRLGLDPSLVDDARRRIAPERLRVVELLAEAEAAERAASTARADAAAEAASAERARIGFEQRERELADVIEVVRASAARERERAMAEAARDLAGARHELGELRREIRAARRSEHERRRAASTTAAQPAERERDRRLGAADDRVRRATHTLTEVDVAIPLTGPLAPGDPVEAPALGVHGTIATVEGDEALVLGPSGLRVRIPLGQLRPDTRVRAATSTTAPPVRVRTAASAQVSDELDVRGQTAQEAREAARAFVDAASLAGLPQVRIVHGRGTGAVRAAVRDELARHPLVEGHAPDSADGATLVQLGARQA